MDNNELSKNNERILWAGKWTSKVGDIIFDYVNSMLIVHSFTTSSWVLAAYQSSQTIINVLFNLVGGAIADMNVRKKILVITDFLSGIICLVTSFFVGSKNMAISLLVANALLAFIFSFSSPTFKSIVKEMVLKERIHGFNSVSNVGTEIISMLGPVIGLTLMGYIGARGALIVNAVTFFASGILKISLNSIDQEKKIISRKKNVLVGIVEGLCYLWTDKGILYLVVLSACVNFFLAGYNLMVPYSDILYEKKIRNFYSMIMVVQALGGIIGAFINAHLPVRITSKYFNMILLLGGTGGALLIPASIETATSLFVCLLPFFAFGMFLTMYNINFMSYVQENVPEEYLGRVFSIIFTAAVIFMPFGSIIFTKLDIVKSIRGFSISGFGIVVLATISSIIRKMHIGVSKL